VFSVAEIIDGQSKPVLCTWLLETFIGMTWDASEQIVSSRTHKHTQCFVNNIVSGR